MLSEIPEALISIGVIGVDRSELKLSTPRRKPNRLPSSCVSVDFVRSIFIRSCHAIRGAFHRRHNPGASPPTRSSEFLRPLRPLQSLTLLSILSSIYYATLSFFEPASTVLIRLSYPSKMFSRIERLTTSAVFKIQELLQTP
ncbi:hypothetical protein SISNIDRAFT_36142 [Sistotremastrum niveocremeum HHB9708]|uniref:Uncharacterized protein n=1 Tax=Sistotremastrum niveocremeum HHB9708 TaxID=1314777 RepID=A0A164WFB1_9AGAM|nr:hypothetical protein SISNIDRAFT_36142 [Sistotremastrum niveocremeum HHB9708]